MSWYRSGCSDDEIARGLDATDANIQLVDPEPANLLLAQDGNILQAQDGRCLNINEA